MEMMHHSRGFTLIELLVSISIFTVIIVAFIGMLVAVTNIGVQQSSASVVQQESQALLQKVQYYVGTASLIATSTLPAELTLRMPSSTADPTLIYASSTGVVYIQQGSGQPQPLTSGRVFVSGLAFARQANPPGHDVVNVSFNMKYNSLNATQVFSQLFQSSVVHVSAATFDTGLYPSASTQQLGNSSNLWSPINGVIYTSGANVGINQSAPSQPLDVNGGVRLNPTSASQPSCTSGSNALGELWFSPGGSGAGLLYLCTTNASGTYGWHQVVTY